MIYTSWKLEANVDAACVHASFMLKPCLHVRLRGLDEDDLVASDCSLFMSDNCCCCSIAYTNCLKDTSFNNSSEMWLTRTVNNLRLHQILIQVEARTGTEMANGYVGNVSGRFR